MSGWPWAATLLVALLLVSWCLERTLSKAARDRYKTLTAVAEAALSKSEYDSAARYALAAIKGHDLPLIGFDDSQAEGVLALGVSHANRENLGQPVRQLQLPKFETKRHSIDSPPQTAWVSATNSRAILLTGDDHHRFYSQWDVDTGTMIGEPYDFPKGAFMVNTSDDNRYAIMLGGTTYLYDFEKRVALPQHIPAIQSFSSVPVYSNSYKVMIVESDDSAGFVVWDFSLEKPTSQVVKIDYLNYRLSADGRYLLLYQSEGRLAVWDIATRSFLPPASLAALKARGLSILGGKAIFDLESPWNDQTSLSAEAASHLTGAPVVLTNAPYRYQSFLDSDERPIYSDGSMISVVKYDHVLTTYKIDPALLLRGPKLQALACSKFALKRFTHEEIAAVPILSFKRDNHICA